MNSDHVFCIVMKTKSRKVCKKEKSLSGVTGKVEEQTTCGNRQHREAGRMFEIGGGEEDTDPYIVRGKSDSRQRKNCA